MDKGKIEEKLFALPVEKYGDKYIEHLLEQSLRPTITSAVILAGGPSKEPFGPLFPLDSKPLITYTIDLLHRHGVNTIIIATNNQGKQLQEMLGDGASLGVTLYYVFEDRPLGTAGALRHAAQGPAAADHHGHPGAAHA